MKKLLLAILLILPFYISAQENWVYSEVVEVKEATANDLYLRCKSWFATSFNDSRNVIVSDNIETGMIANVSFQVNFKSAMMMRTGHVKLRMEIYFKEGRYKYELKDFTHEDTNGSNYPSEGGSLSNVKPACGTINLTMRDWKIIKDITSGKVTGLTESLKIQMNSPLESQKDNW